MAAGFPAAGLKVIFQMCPVIIRTSITNQVLQELRVNKAFPEHKQHNYFLQNDLSQQEMAYFISSTTAQSVYRRAKGWTAGGSSPGMGKRFSLLHIVQTGSGAHPPFYPMDTEPLFPGVKRQGREVHHSPPSSTEVKNGGVKPPFPNPFQWRCA
jgi:hypothetical protein